jgi:segregation and condensation protein B
MSLKAKLEAVIYAAEEPVTLAQLASLFAAEALEHKTAQAENETSASEQMPLVAEDEPGQPEAAIDAPEAQLPGRPVPVAADIEPEAAAEPVPDAESEARQAARQRDREVKAILKSVLAELIAACEDDDRGIEIREIAGGYRMATKPSCHDAVRLFVKSLKPPLKLSLPALETLAVIAYKQPVTAPEVSEIRGVESGGVLGSLMARKLIATAGRKQVIGRPILYKTTREFLLRFGLKDLAELPSMEEFEKIAAVEIDEMEPAETAASENASNPEETIPEEPSQQAETETSSNGSEESSKEGAGEKDGREEIRAEGADAWRTSPSEESSGEEGQPEVKESR